MIARFESCKNSRPYLPVYFKKKGAAAITETRPNETSCRLVQHPMREVFILGDKNEAVFGRVCPQFDVTRIPESEVSNMSSVISEINLNKPSQSRRKLVVDETLHAESSTA